MSRSTFGQYRPVVLSVAGVLLLAVLSMKPGGAWAASGLKLCVPKREGAALLTPRHGACKKGYKLTSLGAEGKRGPEGKQGPQGKSGAEGQRGPEGTAGFTAAQAEQLKLLLPYIKLVASGIDGKPTVQFSGVNVQVLNGEGKTTTANGEGNLVIGYDENPGMQTGSHNLILGESQTFTSFGGIDAGLQNKIEAPYATVTGGEKSTASGLHAAVTGGFENLASGEDSSVTGGVGNTASGEGAASVSGGVKNVAKGESASVGGGLLNFATGPDASVSGGVENAAGGKGSSVSGGNSNLALGSDASIAGGAFNVAIGEGSAILGEESRAVTGAFQAAL